MITLKTRNVDYDIAKRQVLDYDVLVQEINILKLIQCLFSVVEFDINVNDYLRYCDLSVCV